MYFWCCSSWIQNNDGIRNDGIRILETNEDQGKWSDIVAVMLLDIISGEIKLESILSLIIFEWLLKVPSHLENPGKSQSWKVLENPVIKVI